MTVTATQIATGQVRTTTTGADGTYKFSLLQPGDYKVRFSANGFKTSEVDSVTLNVTETPELDRTLEVGAQSEQITVEAAAEALADAEFDAGNHGGFESGGRVAPQQSQLHPDCRSLRGRERRCQ